MPRKKTPTTEFAVAKPETIDDLDRMAIAVRDGADLPDASPFSEALGLAGAVQHLRAALTDEVMAPIMELQSTPIGFRTDRDMKKKPGGGYAKGDGYPVAVVRDIVIESCRHGARMVGNEFNIIGGRMYLTKEYFQRKLDDAIGRGNWRLMHNLPQVTRNNQGHVVGAVVTTSVEWRANGEDWQKQEVEFAIKGDNYSTSDAFTGKADRKAGAWLYRQVTGKTVPDGEADAINVTAKPVRQAAPVDAPPQPEPAEQPSTADPDAKPCEEVAPLESAAYRAELAEIVNIPGAEAVNTYLIAIGWITDDQSYMDLDDNQIRRICKGKDTFIAQCLGEEEV